MPAAAPRFVSAASSDQGLVRSNNEDRVYCDDSRGIFVVVDGLGGHQGGEKAAEIAIQRIRARLERQNDGVEQRLREAITLANNAIFEAAQEQPVWKGMACVLTAAVIENGRVTVGHVGDSRLYRITPEIIEKLTHDHSPVGEREDRGELSEAAAMQHPRRNEVYRDVGSQEHAPDDDGFIEAFEFPFNADSALLLCSDGLSDAVSSEQILNTVRQHAGDRWATVQALIASATEVGRDNVSVVLVEGEGFEASLAYKVGLNPAGIDQTATEQSAPPPMATQGTSWYRRGPAYLLYGVLLGATLVFAIGSIVFGWRPTHTSRTLVVPSGHSISGFLRRAQPGDTVIVAPGAYSETVTLKEGVSVVAQQAGKAEIERGVTAENLHLARLEGFQVRGEDIGIRVANSNVVLARDDIAGAQKAGVDFIGSSRGAIFGCSIHDNDGPGIVVSDTASPTIENNVIVGNGKKPNALSAGLILRSSAQPEISGNIFAANGAEAIWLRAPDESIIRRNSFSLATSARNPDLPQAIRILPPGDGRP